MKVYHIVIIAALIFLSGIIGGTVHSKTHECAIDEQRRWWIENCADRHDMGDLNYTSKVEKCSEAWSELN